jgi:hypothetical protein
MQFLTPRYDFLQTEEVALYLQQSPIHSKGLQDFVFSSY